MYSRVQHDPEVGVRMKVQKIGNRMHESVQFEIILVLCSEDNLGLIRGTRSHFPIFS